MSTDRIIEQSDA